MIKSSYFISFVVPFFCGCVFLFAVILFKYIKWIHNIDKEQRKTMWQNFFSRKIFSAFNEVGKESLLHLKVYKTNPLLGYMHMSLAFGWFLMILVGKIESSIYNRTLLDDPSMAIFFRYFVRDPHSYYGEPFLSFLMDFLLLVVLSGLVLAFIKRFRSRWMGMKSTTKHTILDRITLTTLWFIFPLRLSAESVTAGITHNGSFLTQTCGNGLALTGLPLSSIELPIWWAYALILCAFFACMPFSRYMHIFTEPVLIFLRKLGAVSGKNYSTYSTIQLNACSRCGICINVCPLYTQEELRHVQSVYFIADTRYKRLSEEVVNQCLMCNRCVDACPVGLDLTQIRQQLRNKEEIPGKSFYEYSQTFESNSSPEVIYFAGCMSRLTPSITRSMKQIFDSAGERYWFMDEEKGICCGRPLNQQGYLQQAEDLVAKNKQRIESSGAKRLVTSCPICYKSFKEDYSLNIEVMHHSEYIEHLIQNKQIHVNKTELDIAYHDPCELGRGSGIYEQPRQVLKAVGNLVQTSEERQNAPCCGGSLANTLLTIEQQSHIRDQALDVLNSSNPDVLATACPLCKKTFTNGNKVEVKDIAEIVAGNLNKSLNFDNK